MMTPFIQKGDRMYYKTLNEIELIHNTVKCDAEWRLSDLPNDLFIKESNGDLIKIIPLFYFDTVESSNPNDSIINKGKVLIVENKSDTVLHFFSDTEFDNYDIIKVIKTNDDIEDTLIFTYNSVTGEKVGNVRAEGILTDKYGYYHKMRRVNNV